jgi:hypothetical protein
MPAKKKASASPARACANCGVFEEPPCVTLFPCLACHLVFYCGKPCQLSHWKKPAGHKEFCLTPEERRPAPSNAAASADGSEECAICLDPLGSSATCVLPCSHSFHVACVEGMRALSVAQACPLCRAELPPGPDKLFDEGCRLYFSVKRLMARSDGSWSKLTKAQQRTMNEVRRLFKVAADQGHAVAQFNLGLMYEHGRGVPQSDKEAAVWYRKAADHGDAGAQFNLGLMYYHGRGVPQSDNEAAVWCRKAADQGHASAQYNMGIMYAKGIGVPLDLDNALHWLQKAEAQNHKGAIDAVRIVKRAKAASPAAPQAGQSTPNQVSPPSLSQCANCGAARGPGGGALKPCGQCKSVVYCGKECQKAHWKGPSGHKKTCAPV